MGAHHVSKRENCLLAGRNFPARSLLRQAFYFGSSKMVIFRDFESEHSLLFLRNSKTSEPRERAQKLSPCKKQFSCSQARFARFT